jgi:hypothetical protein
VQELPSSHAWIDRDPVFDAHCVSVVVGSTIEQVVLEFQADPASVRQVTFAEQRDMGMPYPQGFGNDTVQIDSLDDAIVCTEANGWAGVDEHRARALSAHGLHVACYRSVNADMQVVCARSGTLVRSFDPLLYDRAGALPEEAGLPFGEPGASASAAFALVGRLTGIRLTRRWLVDERHPGYRRDPEA